MSVNLFTWVISIYGSYPLSRIPILAFRASIFFTLMSSPSIEISPLLRAFSITVMAFSTSSGISRISTPALYAASGISFLARPLSFDTPYMSSASVQIIPSNPSFSLRSPVTIGLDIEDGVPVESRDGMLICPTMTMSVPAAISLLKGYNSRVSSLSMLYGNTGSARWESTLVSPWPGKCFAQPATPPSCRPKSIVVANLLTFSLSSPNERKLTICLSGLLLRSTAGE